MSLVNGGLDDVRMLLFEDVRTGGHINPYPVHSLKWFYITMHHRAGLILKESTAFGGCAQISKETAKVSEGCSVDRE